MALSSSLIARRLALGALLVALATAPAFAVTMGGGSEPPASSEADDYTRGAAAFEREDWQAVIDHMTQAIEQRPWHDDAYNLMGFAYRKLGDYDQALQSYDRALELNPHHRGALEYLGEAYLELDQPQSAKAMLDRLELECRRVASDATDGGWQSDCEEWQELSAAYQAYVAANDGK
ncbi:MAG: tetratricopeptide repeat protein [Geminicoccaceae bacterium]